MVVVGRLIVYALAFTWGVAAVAATASVDGSNVFGQPSITDAQGNTWTIVSGVVVKNGVQVGNNHSVTLLLKFQDVFYQRNSSDWWYKWTGTEWKQVSDPRVISGSDSAIGVGRGVLVDSGRHVWTISSAGIAYEDGVRADGNYNTIALLYYKGVIYCENTSDDWYSWNGASWSRVPQDPITNNPTAANGASIGVGTATLIDLDGNVWTLPSNEIAEVNGFNAGGNHNTILVLWYNKTIYSKNTQGLWYSWTGGAWHSAAGDPRGPNLVQTVLYTSPVCPASNPGCVPPDEVNSSVTFSRVTTKGDALWVAATVSDYGGIHVISVTDSQNNTFHELGQENDKRPGSQSVAHFYAGNIQGGADTITVHWTVDNYKGVVAAEIAGVSASPLVGSSSAVQDGHLPSGIDNVSAAAVPLGPTSSPSFVIAVTMDTDGGGSDTGGSGFCAVPAGKGFSQVLQLWNWAVAGQPACNLATLETMSVPGTGSGSGSGTGTANSAVAGTFTTTHLDDPYVTVSAVFH